MNFSENTSVLEMEMGGDQQLLRTGLAFSKFSEGSSRKHDTLTWPCTICSCETCGQGHDQKIKAVNLNNSSMKGGYYCGRSDFSIH